MNLSHMDKKYFENLKLKKGDFISVITENCITGLYNGIEDNYVKIARVTGKKEDKFKIKTTEKVDLSKILEIKKLSSFESVLD